ncbi:MAG: ABC transporter permease [Candidatus Acidiferrales bacterium]
MAARWIEAFGQDLRFGLRMMRKNPGFSCAAILTLALGIGGNTAIFTITSAALLRPLPYHRPQQLVLLDTRQKDGASRCCTLGWSDLIRDRNQSFSGVAVGAPDSFNLTGRGEPEQLAAARVSPGFFELLGVKAEIGRTFLADEGQPAGKPVVMISDGLWHSRFGGNRNAIGQTLTLDTAPYTIIGVLPAGVQFAVIGSADVWSPRYFEHSLFTPQRLRMGVGYLTVVARLRPEVSRQRALAEMQVLHQQYRKENPGFPDADPGLSPAVTSLSESLVANIRTGLLLLSAAVGVVLLIAGANVASLLLSRALGRRKEIAVRTALGAPRSVVLRQLLTESVLLAVVAGALGLGLSWAATRFLATFGQGNIPQGVPIGMDARVLLFALTISLLTGIIFGIFPALQLSRIDVNTTLRDEGRSHTGDRSRARLKSLLVVGQVALSLVLLIGASLLVRSFAALLNVNPGFDPRNVLTMAVSLPTVKYADPQRQIAFFDELLRRVSALPGLSSAAISAALPLTPKRVTPVLPEGQPEVPLGERPFTIVEATSPRFLETMRIPLLAGRAFNDADTAQSPKVIVVNESLAQRYWPNENAVGKHIVIGRQTTAAEIVGITADVKNSGLAILAAPQIYLPFPQLPWGQMNLLIRTANDPHRYVSAVREQISAIDPDQPVTNIKTVEELMDGSRAQPRFMMFLMGMFSATALALAMVGIYGVLAYSVAQRRGELGIRLALGAGRSDILRLVVGQGLTLTGVGIAIGLGLALAVSFAFGGAASGVLYKVGTRDAATFACAPLALIAIALVASYLPARRAGRVDPAEALRNE